MTIKEARGKLTSEPLVFGNEDQIQAVNHLSAVEEMAWHIRECLDSGDCPLLRHGTCECIMKATMQGFRREVLELKNIIGSRNIELIHEYLDRSL